nr:hypothetical protein [Solirubrobacterales bacterium]
MAEPHDDTAPTPEALPAARDSTPLDAGALEAALQRTDDARWDETAAAAAEVPPTAQSGPSAAPEESGPTAPAPVPPDEPAAPAVLASRTGLERTTRSVAAIVEAAEQAAVQM